MYEYVYIFIYIYMYICITVSESSGIHPENSKINVKSVNALIKVSQFMLKLKKSE